MNGAFLLLQGPDDDGVICHNCFCELAQEYKLFKQGRTAINSSSTLRNSIEMPVDCSAIKTEVDEDVENNTEISNASDNLVKRKTGDTLDVEIDTKPDIPIDDNDSPLDTESDSEPDPDYDPKDDHRLRSDHHDDEIRSSKSSSSEKKRLAAAVKQYIETSRYRSAFKTLLLAGPHCQRAFQFHVRRLAEEEIKKFIKEAKGSNPFEEFKINEPTVNFDWEKYIEACEAAMPTFSAAVLGTMPDSSNPAVRYPR